MGLKRSFIVAVGALAGIMTAVPAMAALITNGFTFAVATSSSDQSVGTHFHSNTGGVFGNPAGKAEVGRFSTEAVRGLSEYDLTGQTTATSAFVTFDVFKLGGLFSSNNFPFVGNIVVDAYAGNNAENISDFQALSIGSVGSFATTGLAVGDILSFDITSIFNAAVTGGQSSLGIRLAGVPLPTSGALTFDTFRLTTDNQSTNPGLPVGVPEPLSLGLLAAGLVVTLGLRRKVDRVGKSTCLQVAL